jgi:hypothetical protein
MGFRIDRRCTLSFKVFGPMSRLTGRETRYSERSDNYAQSALVRVRNELLD